MYLNVETNGIKSIFGKGINFTMDMNQDFHTISTTGLLKNKLFKIPLKGTQTRAWPHILFKSTSYQKTIGYGALVKNVGLVFSLRFSLCM